MRDRLRIVLALLQLPREIADQLRGLQRDRRASNRRLEFIRIVKQPAELFQIFWRAHIGQRDGVNLRRRAGEMGVDINGEPIADNQQRRIIER